MCLCVTANTTLVCLDAAVDVSLHHHYLEHSICPRLVSL